MITFSKFAKTFKSFYTGKGSLLTNTITAGTLGCFADAVAQVVEIRIFSDQAWDLKRLKNMSIVSAGFGPVAHYWYQYLDNKFPGKTKSVLFKKVGLDLLLSPLWYGIFICGLCILKNYSLKDSLKEYKEKAPILVGADLAFWPILQTLNFLFFPPHYRIIGFMFNESILDILISHLVNNEYGLSQVLSKFSNRKESN